MPRKSKEELLEKDIIDSKKATKIRPSTVKAKTAVNKESTKKVASSKPTSNKNVATSKKAAKVNSEVSSSVSSKKSKTSSKSQISTRKRTTISKAKSSSAVEKTKASSKAVKKSSKTKSSKMKKQKLSNKPKKLSPITLTKKAISNNLPFILEYYDLPYKYNKTVIKALAQNPNTLFVYWEISDENINSLKEKYGENIFDLTRPVLIIHNLTDKYSFEVDINDFANNWYIHVNNSKCQYVIELVRRPKESNIDNISDNYLYITSSNMIESPNDHVLFYDSEQIREVRFKNINTNKYTTRVIKPFLKNIYELYSSLHLSKENVSYDLKNPSSQNPTSNLF